MKIAFLIFVGWALLGFLYLPGFESLTAFAFITLSCSPLLLGGAETLGTARPFQVPRGLFYWLVVGLGFLNLTMIAAAVGRPPSELLSLEGFVLTAGEATARRYSTGGASGNPILLAISLFLIFRVGATADRMSAFRQIIAFLPVALYALLSTEKWPLFLSAVFFFAGLVIAFPARYSLRRLMGYGAVMGPAVVAIAVVAMFLRGSGLTVFIAGDLLHYVLAPYTTLGSWLIDEGMHACCTLGGLSFVGPLDATGITVREAGVFAQNELVKGRETNIYTVFRYIVEDFSLAGPFLIAAWLAGAHAGFKMLGSSALSRQIAGFTIFSSLMSVNVTPFVHNSTALAMALSLAMTLGLSLRLPPYPQAEPLDDATMGEREFAGAV